MITITTAPTGIKPAFNPIIFETTSDRYSSTAVAVTAVSSGTGGKARYTVASHPYKVGDVILGSAFTGLNVAYNVSQTITVISALYFETNISFVATATGSGTITRTNNNFQIKCQTMVFDQPKLNITSVTNDANGKAVLHVTNTFTLGQIIFVEGTTDYDGSATIIQNNVPLSGSLVTINKAFTSDLTGKVRGGTFVGVKRQDAIIVSGSYLFRMNCAGHVQSTLSPDLIDSTPANTQTPCSNSIKPFAVVFTEEFDDTNGILQTHDTIVSDQFYGARLVLQNKNLRNLNPYTDTHNPRKFLTNSPIKKLIRPGEEEQLSLLSNPTESIKIAYVKYSLGGVAASVAYTSLIAVVDSKCILPINSNLFSANESKIEVWAVDNSNNQLTEKRTFIVDNGSYQNPIRIYFETTLGGFDAFTFTGDFTRSGKSIKTSYKKTLHLAFVIKDRGVTDNGNNNVIANEIYSQLLSKSEALWLNELLQSVSVFTKQIGETVFTPITILSDSQPIYDSKGPSQLKLVYTEANQQLGLEN